MVRAYQIKRKKMISVLWRFITAKVRTELILLSLTYNPLHVCATLKCWALKQEKQQMPFSKSLVWPNWESIERLLFWYSFERFHL